MDLIVNTHSHPDHSGANRWFKQISNAKIEVEFLLPGHGDIVKGRKLVEENFEYVKGVFFH